jgi:chromosome segregation ATPase
MATRKRVADVLQEEAHKISSPEVESIIDVTAEEVPDETTPTTEESVAKNKRTTPTKADLETTINQLQTSLEETRQNEVNVRQQLNDLQSALSEKNTVIKQLQASVAETQQNQKNLQSQISDLQSALSEKDKLVERLTKELDEAKQAAVQLAQANSQLTEEINNLHNSKKEKAIPKALTYRKSYRAPTPEKLPPQTPTEPADNSNQMWLLD